MDLWHIPAIDAHAHLLPTPDAVLDVPYTAAFTERSVSGPIFQHIPHRLHYQHSLRDIGALLSCDPTVEAIATQRDRLGFEQIAQICFDAAHLEAVLLDKDQTFSENQYLSIDCYQPWVTPHRLLCLEQLAEQLIPKVDRFDVFLEWFRSELDPIPQHVVGFTSIAACRSGLDIHLVYPETAEECFYGLKLRQADTDTPLPLPKELIDFLLLIALDSAARYGVPIQFQAGIGAAKGDLRLANPLHLRPILEEPQYQAVPIVLLNGAYPFAREAGYLASVYSQAYIDIGMAVPGLSIRGMTSLLHHLLESAPTSKILYSSSGRLFPELFYVGAKRGRRVLGQVLEELVQDGDLTAQQAESGAIAILNGNARRLYALPVS